MNSVVIIDTIKLALSVVAEGHTIRLNLLQLLLNERVLTLYFFVFFDCCRVFSSLLLQGLVHFLDSYKLLLQLPYHLVLLFLDLFKLIHLFL